MATTYLWLPQEVKILIAMLSMLNVMAYPLPHFAEESWSHSLLDAPFDLRALAKP
jgi:hypothetical protein